MAQESIARTDEVARLAAQTTSNADAKLDQIDLQARRIHTLVNSDMTAARQSELNQTRSMLVVLQRVVALARERGLESRPEDLDATRVTTERVKELEQILADRLHRLQIVEAEQAVHHQGQLTGPARSIRVPLFRRSHEVPIALHPGRPGRGGPGRGYCHRGARTCPDRPA